MRIAKWTAGIVVVVAAILLFGTIGLLRAANTAAVCVFDLSTTGACTGSAAGVIQADTKGDPLFATDGTTSQLVVCNQEAQYDTNTSGKTQIVALSSGKKIYVCGFSFFAGGTVSVDLNQGTGTNCATGTNTKMTPTYALTTQTGIVDSRNFGAATGPNISVASQALCIETNAGVAVQARVQYAQF